MMARWHPVRLGHRGAFLLLFGSMWSLAGVGRLHTPLTGEQLAGFRVLLEMAPYRTWMALWLVCGLLAVLAAFFRRPGEDTFGFVALIVPVSLWCASNAVMFLFYGYEYGLPAAAIYACLIVALIIVTGGLRHETGR